MKPNDLIDLLNTTIEKTRKETVKEFTKTLISLLWEEEKGETITIKDLHSVIRAVAKSVYGVEVE